MRVMEINSLPFPAPSDSWLRATWWKQLSKVPSTKWFRYFEFESRAQSKYDTTSLPVLQVVIALGSIPLPNFLGFYLLTVGAARLLSLFIADAARDWLEDDGWWQSGSESLSEDISSTSSTRVSRMLIWPTGVRSPVKDHWICSIIK